MKTEFLLSERDRANAALRESEQRYKRLLAATTDYIYTVDLERDLEHQTSHGPGCEAVTGYSPSDFASDPYLWYRIIHEADRPAVLNQVDLILHGELPPPIEHRITHRDGTLRWIRNTTIPHRSESGRLVAYDGLITDITERKRWEETLKAERNLLRTLVDNLPDYIFVKDTQSRFIMDNLPHSRALGATDAEAVLGKTEGDFLPEEEAALHRAEEECVFRSGRAQFNAEESSVDATGARRWFSTTRVPLKDLQGKIVGLVGIGHEITGLKRAEQALRESQERLSLVIRGSNDGIWDWNILTNEAYFSPRWKNMLGYEDHEIENRFSAWEELIHPDDRELARQRVQAYLAGDLPTYELEHRLRHKTGSYRWILARGVVLRDQTGTPVRLAGSHMDLTELKSAADRLQHANIELKETQAHLIQAARFESMGTLAAGVAHEVKNPLQTILMGLHYLSQKLGNLDGDLALTLSDMRESVTHANTIIGDLLTLSKATLFQMQLGSLNRIIQNCLRLVRNPLEAAQVLVALRLDPDLPQAKLDESRIEQVFLNLFLNSIHAMPGGGTLTVTTRVLELNETTIANMPMYRAFKPTQRLLLAEVRDTGTGIKEADLPRVFDPFFTTKPVGIGTGLGLSMAKMIIDRHEGVIDIRNASGGGVLATIALKAD